MNVLSGHEEILMLAILKLKDNAYGVTIRREVSRASGKDWSIGAVYDPLYRMQRKGLIESFLSKPTQERGGRSKRIFRIRKQGLDALKAQKMVRDRLRQRIENPVLDLG
jgi:PadR family transcriptional regulator PadR